MLYGVRSFAEMLCYPDLLVTVFHPLVCLILFIVLFHPYYIIFYSYLT